MPRTTAPSTNPRILAGYAPYTASPSGSPPASPGASTPSGAAPSMLSSSTSTSRPSDRLAHLLADPLATDVQPEQVTCTRCLKTVRLQKGKSYHLAHWLDHRWKCDQDPKPVPSKTRCHSLPERQAILEADAQAASVHADRVLCARCGRDVRCRKGRPFDLANWTQHKAGCPPSPAHAGAPPCPSLSSSRDATPTPSPLASPRMALTRLTLGPGGPSHAGYGGPRKELSPLEKRLSHSPPPWLERTPLVLPIPEGYYRFESASPR